MPPLKRPPGCPRVALPARDAVLAAHADVVVVGGGPAGIGAALGAADAGTRVVLVERYGFLGGNATAALVMPLMSFHTQSDARERSGDAGLMPMDHGPGQAVIAGALRRLLECLVREGGAIAPSLSTGYVVPFDPEVFKRVAFDLLDESGVDYLLHSFASDALREGDRVAGVVLESKSGPLVLRAHAVVDCSGDADIAARAGAEFSVGRDCDGLVQPMTLMARVMGFERSGFEIYVRQHPRQWRGVHGLWDLIRQATAAGELDLPREDLLFFGTLHGHEIALNSTRVTHVLGTEVWDLGYAEWRARRQLHEIERFMRKWVPGFQHAYVAQSGVQVGVRESRRVIGDYVLTADDILTARKFDDVIARGTYPVDIHNPAGKGTVLRRLPPGEAYDIPLRCLLPKAVSGLLVAGRAISGTHEAHSSYRVMPISMATGQAAGVCAALAAQLRCSPREVGGERVQAELIRQGASLRATPPGT